MAVAEELVPCVAISFDNDVNLETGAATNCFDRPVTLSPEEFMARWQVYCREHPGIAFLEKGGHASVFALTDFVSQRQFEKTAFHHEITRPCGVSHQLGVILPVPGYVAGMALSRDKDFSESEREVVEMLHPHFVQAFQNAQLFTSPARPAGLGLSRVARAWPDPARVRSPSLADGRQAQCRDRRHSFGAQPRTIGKHVEHLLAKLGVETRAAAAAEARRLLVRSAIPPLFTAAPTPEV